jgi:hypothetical protein
VSAVAEVPEVEEVEEVEEAAEVGVSVVPAELGSDRVSSTP